MLRACWSPWPSRPDGRKVKFSFILWSSPFHLRVLYGSHRTRRMARSTQKTLKTNPLPCFAGSDGPSHPQAVPRTLSPSLTKPPLPGGGFLFWGRRGFRVRRRPGRGHAGPGPGSKKTEQRRRGRQFLTRIHDAAIAASWTGFRLSATGSGHPLGCPALANKQPKARSGPPPAKGRDDCSSSSSKTKPLLPGRGFVLANPSQSSSAIHACFMIRSYLCIDGKGSPSSHTVDAPASGPTPRSRRVHRFSPPSLTGPRFPGGGCFFGRGNSQNRMQRQPRDPARIFRRPC